MQIEDALSSQRRFCLFLQKCARMCARSVDREELGEIVADKQSNLFLLRPRETVEESFFKEVPDDIGCILRTRYFEFSTFLRALFILFPGLP